MKVHLFFRKPTHGFRSLEELFDIVISALNLANLIIKEVPEKRITPRKLWANLHWVRKHRGKVNHITGDIHYISPPPSHSQRTRRFPPSNKTKSILNQAIGCTG